jgi:hypothetical protein
MSSLVNKSRTQQGKIHLTTRMAHQHNTNTKAYTTSTSTSAIRSDIPQILVPECKATDPHTWEEIQDTKS